MEQAYYKSDVGNLCVIIENQEVTRIFFVDKIQENSVVTGRVWSHEGYAPSSANSRF